MLSQDSRSNQQLALEAVRSAQLLAYQNGWKKIIIRNDVQEMVTALQQKRDMYVDHLLISEDIILLQQLFDDCIFSFVPRQHNLDCVDIAKLALDKPGSAIWQSNLSAWL